MINLKPNGSKNIFALVVIFFSGTPKRQLKRMKKQNQNDDFKENILENQDKFDILTKDLVCNIEKRVLKRTNKN